MTYATAPEPQVRHITFTDSARAVDAVSVVDIRSIVQGVAVAVGPTTLTPADVRMIVELIEAHGRRNWRTDLTLIVAILGVIVAWLAYQQDRIEYARPDPAPVVVVGRPGPAELDQMLDEREREAEQGTTPDAGPDGKRTSGR